MKDSAKTIIFATVLGVVCAGLLALASSALKPYQEANKLAEKWRNVYDVLGVKYDPDANSHELLKLVHSKDNPAGVVFEHTLHQADGNMMFYTYDNPADGRLYAFEFSGMGLWDKIKGLLCLRSDLQTVYNISFYEQTETPGLGGEIAAPPVEGKKTFRGQFPGKTIDGPGGPGIRVTKPDMASGPNQVDGISAATLTGDKVEEMINKVSRKILDNKSAIIAASGGGAEAPAAISALATGKEAGHE